MDASEVKKIWDTFLVKKDEKSRKKLLEHYFTYVQKIATNLSKKYNNKVSSEELASHGITGLYRAINYYDEDRGVKFETYAYSRIKGAMIDGIRSEDWVPRSVRLRQTSIEKEKLKKEYELGHRVPETDVLKGMGIKEAEFHKKRKKYRAISVSSLENTLCSDIDADENKKDFNKYLADSSEEVPGGGMIRKEFLKKLMSKDFNMMERKMIYFHYYENLTMKDIANRFDISESRMSQIHRSVLKRLKNKIKNNPAYFSKDVLSLVSTCNNKDSLI